MRIQLTRLVCFLIFAMGISILKGCTGFIPIVPKREMPAKQVQADVSIYRDSMGVPHIYGNSEKDVMFAVGYTMAEDRLFQLEMSRRAGAGELSAVFGEDTLTVDRKARINGYTEDELTGMLDNLDPGTRMLFKSMVDGINHYIEQAIEDPDSKKPFEFDILDIPLQPYREQDILEALSPVIRLYATAGGNELFNQQFLDELVKRYGEADARIIFDDVLVINDPDAYTTMSGYVNMPTTSGNSAFRTTSASGLDLSSIVKKQRLESAKYYQFMQQIGYVKGASRSLTIGPQKSKSGNILMMQATADGHEVHIHCPEFNVAGLSMAPFGVPVMGRTDHIGWLITTGERDTIDTFVETLKPDDQYRYLYKGEWKSMSVRTETIEVKDQAPEVIKVARTVHGPVFQWDPENGKAYSRKWASWLGEADSWAVFMSVPKIKSVEEFERTLFTIDPQANNNISVGDRQGNFAVWHTGRLPNRSPQADPRLPVPGTGEYEWRDFIPLKEREFAKNPDRNYLFAWNTKPTPDATYGDASRWGKHFRAYYPISLVEGQQKIGMQDLKRFNQKIAAAWGSVDLSITSPKFFKEVWISAVKDSKDERLKRAVDIMLDWNELYEDLDGDGWYDHPGLPIFARWLQVSGETIFEDDIGEWYRRIDDENYINYRTSLLIRVLEGEKAGLPVKWDFLNGKSSDEIVRDTIRQTLERLKKEYSTNNMEQWKQRVYWRYLIMDGANEAGKSKPAPPEWAYIRESPIMGAAVNLGYVDEAVRHNGLPSWTAIMEIGSEPHRIWSVIPTGGQSWFINSGWKASPHINDQYKRHRDFDYKLIEMDKKEVLKGVESTTLIRAD